MSDSLPGAGALPVRRSYQIDRNGVQGVVIEIDATGEPRALAVQQAGLHSLPPGVRLGFGYEITTYGLGQWVGDRRVQLRVWPAHIDEFGEISEDDPDDPDSELLIIHLDPEVDRSALAGLVETGRLFIAGPDGGPTPIVLDLDRDLLADTWSRTSSKQ